MNTLSALDDFLSEGLNQAAGGLVAAPQVAHQDAAVEDEPISPAHAHMQFQESEQISRALADRALSGAGALAQVDSASAAFQMLIVVGVDRDMNPVDGDFARLKGDLLHWIDAERHQLGFAPSLSSPMSRDVCATRLAHRYIEAARSSSTGCYIAPLPTSRWAAILPQELMATVDVDLLARSVHQQVITQAISLGISYSKPAHDRYSVQQHAVPH